MTNNVLMGTLKPTHSLRVGLLNKSQVRVFVFEQYDTQVEEAFIARAIQEREAKCMQRRPDLPATAPMPVTTTSSPTEMAEVVEPSANNSAVPVPVQHPVTVHKVSDQSEQPRSAFGAISGSSILMPTPIAVTSAGGGMSESGASGSAFRNIDLKDFETEQDPFENLSLRVMNDREELNKVFHVTSPPSQCQMSGTTATVASTAAAAKPSTHSSSLLQYGTGNVPNGPNAASLNWITCQPVPRWPVVNHSLPNTCSPFMKQQHNPYVGRVSGPFADNANAPIASGYYFQSSNFQPPQQLPATSMLRSAKSTPDISKLAEDHAVASARRTPPPVSSDLSTVLGSHDREKVSWFLYLFL